MVGAFKLHPSLIWSNYDFVFAGSTSYSEAEKESLELPVYDTNWGAFSANSEESLFKKPSNLFPASSSSASVPMYDSVHSIKVPLRTYDSKSRAKPMPYHNHRRREAATKRTCPTVAEVTKQMSGLVFDRVEKSVSFPLYKTTLPVPSVQKKGRCLSISPSTRLQVRLDSCNNYTGCHKTLVGYFRQLYVGLNATPKCSKLHEHYLQYLRTYIAKGTALQFTLYFTNNFLLSTDSTQRKRLSELPYMEPWSKCYIFMFRPLSESVSRS